MSVAEIAPRGEEFERTPPHDLAAEQCVLGGMMLSKDAISDVLEVIKPQDHYRPAHQIVHEVILDLYSRGEPADAVTVAAELTKRGDIGRMGGAPYLHTLIASVPTAANAGYYARIVRERALLRRLVEVGTRIVQLGYSGDGDADDLVDRAEAEVYGVTERRVSDDYLPLSEIMPGALHEIEAIGSRGGALTGVPTGFADLDALTNGLHPGQMIVIAARPALGKALALDTPLPTPSGWTTMGQVQAGGYLIGGDGKPARVLAVTGVMYGRPCYEVEFGSGEAITADAGHQWLTWTRAARRQRGWRRAGRHQRVPSELPQVVTTEQIVRTLRVSRASRRPDHAVAAAGPVSLPDADLPVPPYVLGSWLGWQAGAGTGRAAAADPQPGHAGWPAAAEPEIAMRVQAAAPDQEALLAALRGIGALAADRIPPGYLRASGRQRQSLLAGLLDTAGCVLGDGSVQVAAAGRRLALDVRELILTLGYPCPLPSQGADRPGRGGGFLVCFRTGDQVFQLGRKQRRHKELQRHDPQRSGWHQIVSVREVASLPVRCVQVDSPGHLYLAGHSMIPTHNSTFALDLARTASIKHGLASVIFSLEMSRNEITMKLLSAESRVPLHSMRTGQMSDDDWTRLARRMSEVVNAPLFIDDSPNMSMMEIRSKCRRLKQRSDLRLVIVDYLQLMTSPKRIENRQQEVSDMSRSLKLLAKELNVPVIAVAQLNRGPEQRTDKRPLLADLRESGCVTADTTLLRADTGAPVTIGSLLEDGCSDVLVWSVDEQHRLVAAPVTSVFASGIKDVFRLKLASGREVKASANHPFLIPAGWVPLRGLVSGGAIAVPRLVPPPLVAGPGQTEPSQQPVPPGAATFGDLCWDRIESITPLGPMPVYDATVKGTHNFIADGIVAHNSIEQDSDMVILLHREDAYERESPRAGEADLIVAKHRNGPTATVTVAFQGHFSRFVDMARL